MHLQSFILAIYENVFKNNELCLDDKFAVSRVLKWAKGVFPKANTIRRHFQGASSALGVVLNFSCPVNLL